MTITEKRGMINMAESSVFNFSGCKLALLYNDQVLVIRRDNNPSILFSGMLDVTGGTREGNEWGLTLSGTKTHAKTCLLNSPAEIIPR